MYSRIVGVILQEYFIMRRSLEVMADLFYFSIITVVVFGFVSLYLSGDSDSVAAYYLLYGMILWEVIRLTQYSVSVGSLWNMWSRNLSNMFVAPLTMFEYILAEIISGIAKTAVIFVLIGVIAVYVFHFNIFQSGVLNLILFFLNLSIFAWSMGIFVLGLIFKYGTKIQALAWGLIFIFQPLTAALFPVSVLPDFLQKIAYCIPVTYVFEAARQSLSDPSVNWQLMGIAFVLNIVYLLGAALFFIYMFRASCRSGQFARNEG